MQWAIILTAIAGAVFIFLCGWELSKSKSHRTFPEIKNYQAVVILAVICALGLFIRAYYSIPNVFQDGHILYLESDAYYHMGAVDNIFKSIGNTPLATTIFQELQESRLMVLIIAGLSWIVGLGNPSQYLIDSVGALLPPAASVLVIIATYLLVVQLFNKYIALTSCLFIAIIPSEFLHRSLVGFTDQHVFEVLFSVITVLFMVLAAKAKGKRQMLYYALGGIALSLFMVNWEGGFFMVFIVFVYWLIQTLYMGANGQSYMRSTIGITVMLFTTFLLTTPFQPYVYWVIYMALVSAIPFTATLIYYLYHHRKPVPATVLLLSIIVPLVFISTSAIYLYVGARWGGWISEEVYRYYNPSLVLWPLLMVGNFFTPDMLISEAQPLLFPNGVFSLSIAWANFQWLFFLQFATLGLIIGEYRRRLDYKMLVFIVWAVVFLIATLCLRRYAYYLTISIAIMGSVFLHYLFVNLNVRKATVYVSYSVVVLFMAWMFTVPALQVSALSRGQISTDWQESLNWLRTEESGKVAAWGDYGHWIRRIADKEVDYTAGTTGADVAQLFVYDGRDTNELLRECGANYVVMDRETVNGKFHAVVSIAGLDRADFYETFYYWRNSKIGKPSLEPLILFYPRYYESLSVRLFYFNEGDYTPPDVPVYLYDWYSPGQDRALIKVISSVARYGTVGEAQKAIAQSGIEGVIASEYPSFSPVPLSPTNELKIVYSTPSVKIAEVFTN